MKWIPVKARALETDKFNQVQGVCESGEKEGVTRAARILISSRKTQTYKGKSPGFHDLYGPNRKPRIGLQFNTHEIFRI